MGSYNKLPILECLTKAVESGKKYSVVLLSPKLKDIKFICVDEIYSYDMIIECCLEYACVDEFKDIELSEAKAKLAYLHEKNKGDIDKEIEFNCDVFGARYQRM